MAEGGTDEWFLWYFGFNLGCLKFDQIFFLGLPVSTVFFLLLDTVFFALYKFAVNLLCVDLDQEVIFESL